MKKTNDMNDAAFISACKTSPTLAHLCVVTNRKKTSVRDRIAILTEMGKLRNEDIKFRAMTEYHPHSDVREVVNKDDKKEIEKLRIQIEAALELGKHPKCGKIPALKTSGSAIPLICWSDWHMDEVVRPGEVPGCSNEYNAEISAKRADICAQGSAYLVKNVARQFGTVDTAILWLGGDFISGHIHEELAESNSMSPVKAIATLVKPAIAKGIQHILDNAKIEKLVVVCSYGNHGRLTPRIRHKTGHDHSLEWLMYHFLRQQFAGDKRVEFHVADAYHYYYKAFDYTIRFSHGDNINFGGGVGGIAIPGMKAISQWDKIHRADFDVIGHFHQRRDFGKLLVNGSLVGMGAYAVSIKADYERPQQQFAVIQPGKGKTMSAEIFCE